MASYGFLGGVIAAINNADAAIARKKKQVDAKLPNTTIPVYNPEDPNSKKPEVGKLFLSGRNPKKKEQL